MACRRPGHKRGSELCELGQQGQQEQQAARGESDPAASRGPPASYANAAAPAATLAATVPPSDSSTSTRAPVESPRTRGRDRVRPPTRQGTIDFRPRSASVKRPSSRDGEQRAEKTMRIDGKDNDKDALSDSQPVIEDQGGELC